MGRQTLLIIAAIAIVIVVALTLVLVPDQAPQYEVAVRFVNAASRGEEAEAFALLGEDLQAYVRATCPDGEVSACIADTIPPEWGGFINSVFRRSRPRDDGGWDVLHIANYEADQGFSGICVYTHMAQNDAGEWRVQAWSGFVSCDLENAGLDGLAEPDAPNRAP